MAQKQQNVQAELFTQSEEGGQYQPHVFKNQFFLRIRNYEKLMLLVKVN